MKEIDQSVFRHRKLNKWEGLICIPCILLSVDGGSENSPFVHLRFGHCLTRRCTSLFLVQQYLCGSYLEIIT